MPFLPTARLRFVLTSIPETTPPDATFWVRSSLLDWDPAPDGWALSADGSTWVLERDVPLGALLEFKVTRGTGDTEEGDRWGHRRTAHRHVVTGDATVEFAVEGWQDQRRPGKPSTVSGDLERFTLRSRELDLDRDVMVLLPPGYGTSTGRYPVLYLHDGQNVFDEVTAYNGVEWRCDEAANTLAAEGIEAILVAVPVGAERNRIYTPFRSRVNGYEPKAADYVAFLADTLRPEIDRRYRTRTEPGATGIAGSSFGGLVSLYAGLTRPDTWGFVGAFSPSLWVGDYELFGFVEGHEIRNSRVYVDTGTHEAGDVAYSASVVRNTMAMADLLTARTRQTRFVLGEADWHDEGAWARRFPEVLRWFVESGTQA